MAIYKENFTVKGKKKEALLAFHLECDFVLSKNGLPMANVALSFCWVAAGLLLLQEVVWMDCFDLLLAKLREKVRSGMGQNRQASLGVMDSQSVRWGNNRSLNGYDGNKKVKGTGRHIVVDKNGFLLTVMVTVANIHDSKAVLLLMRTLREMFCNLEIIIADGGYRGEIAAQVKKQFNYI